MTSTASDRSGYRSQGRLSPAALGGVIIVHAGLGAAILSMTIVDVFRPEPPIIWTRNIPADPPKAKPEPRKPQTEKPSSRTTSPQPTIVLPPPPAIDLARNDAVLPPSTSLGDPLSLIPPLPVEAKPPVLVQARADSRYARDFQPPYPAAMLRLQKEGDVTLKISIGADGRVLDAVLVSAADPAFFEAARQQAIARWRFLPATRDGVPVASERVMTVHFRLTD